jgi:hypothetical protein
MATDIKNALRIGKSGLAINRLGKSMPWNQFTSAGLHSAGVETRRAVIALFRS